MTWIAPKIDWTADDYYNLEDAQRIAGNIAYLKEMAAEIYPASSQIMLLLLRDTYYTSGTTYYFYGRWRVTISLMETVYPDSYNYIDLLQCDYTNYLTLMQLILLSSAPGVETITSADHAYTPYTINHSNPTYQFTGEAIRQKYNGPGTAADPLNAFWLNLTNHNNRCPVNSNWDNPNGFCAMVINNNYRLSNAPFWTYDELNHIENWIRSTYLTFTNYLGG